MTLDLASVPSPFAHTLDLPQGDSEQLLRDAALATGLVDIRWSHDVVGIRQADGEVFADVAVGGELRTYAASWGVASDGYHSPARAQLGITTTKRDYGADSAVADVETTEHVANGRSRIVLDERRPWGLFPFQADRARLVYRINPGESRAVMTSEESVRALFALNVPSIRIKRFLWASAFRLEQLQSMRYRSDRWILAGDAAHAMGPSAGAGLQLGALGAWHVGWRLALIVTAGANHRLLDDYDREQHIAAAQIQGDNETIFRNMALSNGAASTVRAFTLQVVGRIGPITRRAAAVTTLEAQRVPVSEACDVPHQWSRVRSCGPYIAGDRVPLDALVAGENSLAAGGRAFRMVPFSEDGRRTAARAAATFGLPVCVDQDVTTLVSPQPPSFALVRPDQTVVAIIR